MEIKDPFDSLRILRDQIGAKVHDYQFGKQLDPIELIERELESGIEVKPSDIQLVGPYLTYQGDILAILYILNSNSPSSDLLANRPDLPTSKFHFTWCRTLRQMYKQGRFNRYVLSRSKKNTFRVEALEREPDQIARHGERHMLENIRLYPCQNCLSDMNYDGFRLDQDKKLRIAQVESFSIERYLEENDGNFAVMKHLPNTTEENAESGAYTSDFHRISQRLRELANWKCSKCNVNMSMKKEGLHVHHINGVRNDNSTRNMQVLCALCHQSIDNFHKNMSVKTEIQKYIRLHRPSV